MKQLWTKFGLIHAPLARVMTHSSHQVTSAISIATYYVTLVLAPVVLSPEIGFLNHKQLVIGHLPKGKAILSFGHHLTPFYAMSWHFCCPNQSSLFLKVSGIKLSALNNTPASQTEKSHVTLAFALNQSTIFWKSGQKPSQQNLTKTLSWGTNPS